MHNSNHALYISTPRGMRLLLVLFLAAMLVCTGCSNSSDDDAAGSSSASATISTSDEAEESLEEVEFEEIVVVDNDYVTITLTSYELGSTSCKIGATLVNKSDDITYMFANDDDCSVDGVQVDPLFADEVAAGKTAYSTITIYEAEELQDVGVAFTDIYLSFHVYDSDDWTADYVVDGEGAHIYPYGEESATTYERAAADTDIVLVDNDQVTVTVIGFDPDYLWGYAIELYVENKTSSTIMVSADDESVNGIMCDAYWAASVGAGLNSFETLSWYSSSLEEIGITDAESEIEEIEFALRVYNYDTFDYYVDGLVVTLQP